MKTVKLNLTLEIPDEIQWVARQPFGVLTGFVNKPEVFREECLTEEGLFTEYWGVQKDEIDITNHAEQGGNWKKSLRKI